MTRRAYSDQDRRQALELYAEQGPAAASRATGIARTTISQWARRAGVVTVTAGNEEATHAAREQAAKLRAKVRPTLLARALDLIDRMDRPVVAYVGQHGKRVEYERPNAADCKHYATAAAALIDRLRLEEGEAIVRSEQVTSTDFDRQVAELVGQMKEQANLEAT